MDNTHHYLNAIVEFNSGVYLTAIKPVLETVTTDWSLDVGSWTIGCSKVSNRDDNTGNHLLCTVLVLTITAKDQQQSSNHHSVTLHFYHTNDKILIQGSSILVPGISSAKWLVQNLIEPLTANHLATNHHSIEQINNDIISSAASRNWPCNKCQSNIEPSSTQVKDQPLTCKRCSEISTRGAPTGVVLEEVGGINLPGFALTVLFQTYQLRHIQSHHWPVTHPPHPL